jgi:hypothetical protein
MSVMDWQLCCDKLKTSSRSCVLDSHAAYTKPEGCIMEPLSKPKRKFRNEQSIH